MVLEDQIVLKPYLYTKSIHSGKLWELSREAITLLFHSVVKAVTFHLCVYVNRVFGVMKISTACVKCHWHHCTVIIFSVPKTRLEVVTEEGRSHSKQLKDVPEMFKFQREGKYLVHAFVSKQDGFLFINDVYS